MAKDYQLDFDSFKLGYEEYKNYVLTKMSSFCFNYDPSGRKYIVSPYFLRYIPQALSKRFRLLHIEDSFDDITRFLKENIFSEKSRFLSFLQAVYDQQDRTRYNPFESLNKDVFDIINDEGFELDFFWDVEKGEIRNKIDTANTHIINEVATSMVEGNKEMYEQSVQDFLCYRETTGKARNDFYHESLDRMKDLIQNVLTLKHNGIKISEKSRIEDILFAGKSPEFNSIIEMVIKHIHHDTMGSRLSINEKTYKYLWLELNNWLYLLSR
jgi:hypothetical protein